ncbi:hypothetical protein [Arthrobacter sp. 260]|uniref:hypothetical protein n=1 Tax=Arthrobacter sp. 260 TaxID=2735314 RepID=UPI0014920591|nr:hypothetical protein [Arthrobacter sp. 260]NOJ60709.1 hypothetical protein [Arthrobacter sp. 260]
MSENYVACPDGVLVSGHYIEWNGNFYEGYSIGTDMWIRHRVAEDLSAEWIPLPGSFNPGSGRTTYRRRVLTAEVERYVSLTSTGMWRGLQFGIIAYSEDGTVAVRGGYSPEMIELLESGAAPQLEAVEAGRAGVIGDLPWSQMSDFSTIMTDLALPQA